MTYPVSRILRVSAILTLVALALMVWSMLDPTPLPVMIAMTAGQGLGTLAFGLYGYVIIRDVRRNYRKSRSDGDSKGDGPPS